MGITLRLGEAYSVGTIAHGWGEELAVLRTIDIPNVRDDEGTGETCIHFLNNQSLRHSLESADQSQHH